MIADRSARGDGSSGRRAGPSAEPTGASELLKVVSAELGRCREANAAMSARLRQAESQLARRRVLSDEQLLAELPGRTARVLEVANAVADEIVSPAKDTALHLETDARSKAEAVLAAAATHGSGMARQAQLKAQAIVGGAQRTRDQMLADVADERAALLSDLSAKRMALDGEVRRLQGQLAGLRQAHEEARRNVDSLLQRFGPARGRPNGAEQGLQLVVPEEPVAAVPDGPARPRLARIPRQIR